MHKILRPTVEIPNFKLKEKDIIVCEGCERWEKDCKSAKVVAVIGVLLGPLHLCEGCARSLVKSLNKVLDKCNLKK